MSNKQPPSQMKFASSLKMAYFFFSKRTKHPNIYIVIIFCLMVLRGSMDLYEKSFRDKLMKREPILAVGGGQKPSIVPGEMITFMLLKFWWWGVEFIAKMTFEVLITPVGGIITQHILKGMIETEDYSVFDVIPPYCEYIISESGKAVAKIVRLLFVNMSNSMILVLFDFYFIYRKDESQYKRNSLCFIVFMMFIAALKVYHLQRALHTNSQASDANSEKEKLYVETLELLPVVKTSGDETKMIYRYRRAFALWENLTMTFKMMMLSNNYFFNIISSVAITTLLILYIISRSDDPSFAGNLPGSAGDVKNLNRVLSYVPLCILRAVGFYRDLTESIIISQKLFAYTGYSKYDTKGKQEVETFSEAIEIKSLSYSVKDKLVFTNASFTLHRGDKVVLVGKNGTGKSSIFKILLGFDSYKGTILFDGVDFNQLCMTDYRKLISYVPQDTKLFDESIYYNLAYGNSKTFKEIVEECQSMGIHETIMSFPSGYNTGVGEGGKNINGGLKQKIFYTRAFLREAEIYLFDEPTNNLDVNHSEFLLEYIRKEKYANRTFLVICHDEDIANEFPRKLRLEQGQIEEIQKI